ncbi:CD151 antigen [Bemisia tabaci]|uniref:CD151 antigen n=1 Tax=Bemisia tabaci TaxID=7038 RepID=UPI0019473617
MRCFSKVQFTKFALFLMNLLYLLCGLLLITGGILLLSNTHYILISRLIQPSSVQPIFYYVALVLMSIGLVIVSISILGCWATHLDNYCFLAFYLFALLVLLLAESVIGILTVIFPEYLGVNLSRDALMSLWQRTYGVPGKEQFTASIDLVQTRFECCGINSGNDFQASWWRLRELAPPSLLVPLSCCVTNVTDPEAYLDPQPLDTSVCQKQHLEDYREFRHSQGCFEPLNEWIVERVSSLMLAGIGKLTIQLLLLLAIILIYAERSHKSRIVVCSTTVSRSAVSGSNSCVHSI